MKKFGVFLILLGIAVPLIAIVFVDDYQSDAGVIKNIQNMKIQIVLKGEKTVIDKIGTIMKVKQIVIPYKYIFILGICISFTGIYFVITKK